MPRWQIAGPKLSVKLQHFFIISWCFITAPLWNLACFKSACSESGWKHKESGDLSVAVSLRSNHRINHDWFRFSGILRWAARVGRDWLSLERRTRAAGRCLLLSVCVPWTFAPLGYIYVPMDSVNPTLTCKADLHWEGTLRCWLMVGATFTAASLKGAQLCHPVVVFCDFDLDSVTTMRGNHTWGGHVEPAFQASFFQTQTWYFQIWKAPHGEETHSTKQSSTWQASQNAENIKPTFASWALTQLVKVFFWICSCSTVEAER